MPIQFQYESTAYFGHDFKVVIKDNTLSYGLRERASGSHEGLRMVTLDVDQKKIVTFLDSLVRLKESDKEIMGHGYDGMSYTLKCNTYKIKKKIEGYMEMEPEVKKCVNRMMRLHPDLKKPTEKPWEDNV
ncbi:hypothetical protein [Fulvivirga sedimenti]|uniref:Uncharacterized protein n=1 Tax=Fulvivirga sedimenti TaxID=2879465 RepID=A0A9X1KW74_9BACT|nr:hypothetical protein [Fulvivirga sedimenti]MCA6075603.1 hypothetical protein [Fulvivirga sedimenti]